MPSNKVTGYVPADLEDALMRGMVPTAPLVRVLKPLISSHEGAEYRALSRFELEQEYTNFDYADHLLCYVGQPELWQSDEELNDLYYRVNLKDHCRNGHERTEENTWIAKNGDRKCRQCKHDTYQRRLAREKAKEEAA